MVDVPESLVARAHAFLADPREPVDPRDAATVVLLRDRAAGADRAAGMGGVVGVGGDVGGDVGGGGLEVYLLRRAGTMAFAAGMHVFPGGSVDPRDGDAGTAWAGPSPAEWGRRLGCEDQLARALVCAAVRETFEESGVLLAGPSADEVVADTTAEDWEADRQALLDRSFAMSQLLARRGLVLRSDLLAAFAHWITPEFEPRRFDTRFFLAALPVGQKARDVSGEADDADWMGVADAVRAFDEGRLAMLPPTIEALRELAPCASVAAALGAPREVRPILPRLVADGGTLRLVVE
jgi:8-oxo-dGTP pyrophosphatase MutT (NUDIX family)